MEPEKRARVAALNDQLRQKGIGGRILMTVGVTDQGRSFVLAAVDAMRKFDDFTGDNDPYGEHDFAAMTVDGQRVFWKIDYYDQDMRMGAADPAAETTSRVLTVGLAKEY